MALVVCPLCHARITVKEELLGRKAKCPKCANLIELRASEPSPAAITPAPPKPAAPRPAVPKPVPPTPSPVKPKGPTGPPPLPPAEQTDFGAVQASPPKVGRSAKTLVDELEEVEDVEEVEEIEDNRSKRRKRADDYDEDDDRRVGPKRGRRGKWDLTRLGLRIVYFTNFAVLGLTVIWQLFGMFAPATAGMLMPVGRRMNAQEAGALVRIIGSGMVLLYVLAFAAAIAILVGHILCCFAPAAAPKSRAKKSIWYFVAAIGSWVAIIVMSVMMLGMAGVLRGNLNRDAAAATGILFTCFAGLVGLAVIAFFITSFVFWMLFHASVAEHFGDRRIPPQCVTYIIVTLVAPFVIAGLMFAIALLLSSSPTGLFVAALIIGLLNITYAIVTTVWYLMINRAVVALIDDYA